MPPPTRKPRKALVRKLNRRFDRNHGQDARAAGAMVFELLLTIYASKKAMSAREFCLLNFYLGKCNMPGADFQRFGLDGNHQSGRYKRFLDARLPETGPFYVARIPVNLPASPVLKSKDVVFRDVMHLLSQEISESQACQDLIDYGAQDDPESFASLPCYLEHPLVRESLSRGEKWRVPIALYLDGVRFTPVCAGRVDCMATA